MNGSEKRTRLHDKIPQMVAIGPDRVAYKVRANGSHILGLGYRGRLLLLQMLQHLLRLCVLRIEVLEDLLELALGR